MIQKLSRVVADEFGPQREARRGAPRPLHTVQDAVRTVEEQRVGLGRQSQRTEGANLG